MTAQKCNARAAEKLSEKRQDGTKKDREPKIRQVHNNPMHGEAKRARTECIHEESLDKRKSLRSCSQINGRRGRGRSFFGVVFALTGAGLLTGMV